MKTSLLKRRIRHLWLALVAVFLHAAVSQSCMAQELPAIAGHLSILEDPGGTLGLADIMKDEQQARFHPLPSNRANPGYSSSAFWLKVELRGEAEHTAVLSLSPNFLDFIDVYSGKPGGGASTEAFTHHAFGDRRPLPADRISGLMPSVFVDLAEGQLTPVYVRVLNYNTATQINLYLEPQSRLSVRRISTGLSLGAWFGGMLILLVVQVVFFYFDRKEIYLLLALNTLTVILVYFGNLGLSRVLLFPQNGVANDAFIGSSAWSGLSAGALAYALLLRLQRWKSVCYALYAVLFVIGIIGVGFALSGGNALFGPYGSVAATFGAMMTMVLGWLQANRKDQASQLTAVAFTLIGFGASVAMLQRLGVSWLPEWTFNIYGISVLAQTLLLTGAMAIRLRDAETLNSQMQAEALRQSRNAEQTAVALVNERTRELVEARKVAEEALRAEMESQLRQVRFLEVVSHQYRTPLASIRSNIDGMEVALGAIDDANFKRIGRIRRAVARLVEIVEINLTRSRLQGASFKVSMDRVSASAILLSALQRARDLLNDPEIRLHMAEDAAAASLNADAELLELAVVNLLENAVKYSGTRGRPEILLSLTRQEGAIVISVADQGIGIPSADLPHVFENARRGSNAESAEGSGLGLFLVAKVVEAHQGKVSIESAEGEGTTVRLALPAVI